MKNDAVTRAPHIHKMIFENSALRVLEIKINPGEKADMHSHPANIVYIRKPGKLKLTQEHGDTKEVYLKKGQITLSENEVSHTVENIGTTQLLAFQVEFKKTAS